LVLRGKPVDRVEIVGQFFDAVARIGQALLGLREYLFLAGTIAGEADNGDNRDRDGYCKSNQGNPGGFKHDTVSVHGSPLT